MVIELKLFLLFFQSANKKLNKLLLSLSTRESPQ
jgi:hypothetical protein